MRAKVVWTIVLWLVCIRAFSQSYSEQALILSRIHNGGSARVQGMGGVQNALGGDISSAYYNPAGLGMFNRSDFSITGGYTVNNVFASYGTMNPNFSSVFGPSQSASQNTVTLPNIGLALHTTKDGGKGFWGGTFAINFNRTNDFNSTLKYAGTNPENSIIDYFIANANGDDPSQFEKLTSPTDLAYYNYLIGPLSDLDPANPNDQYFTDVTGIPSQSETVHTSGSQNQWSFSYGANFNDKFFLGGGIGIASFNYKSEKAYTETFTVDPMSRMDLNESLTLRGTGINATLGIIFRPKERFQLGFSAATPTSYQIDEQYSATMSSTWNNFEYQPDVILTGEGASTNDLISSYSLKTPWRLSGGMTFFFQKNGFISADAEWLDYGNAKYSGDDDYSVDNDEIKGAYKSTVNLRLGGEYRFKDFRFRTGFNWMPDPQRVQQSGQGQALYSYSLGAGYRKSRFYVDLAAVLGQGNSIYKPYSINTPVDPVVSMKSKTTSFILTLGFPF